MVAMSPIPIEPGKKIQLDGKTFFVLRCEPEPGSDEWTLLLVEPAPIEFLDGMKKLLEHLHE
jgi:hypothetical protein